MFKLVCRLLVCNLLCAENGVCNWRCSHVTASEIDKSHTNSNSLLTWSTSLTCCAISMLLVNLPMPSTFDTCIKTTKCRIVLSLHHLHLNRLCNIHKYLMLTGLIELFLLDRELTHWLSSLALLRLIIGMCHVLCSLAMCSYRVELLCTETQHGYCFLYVCHVLATHKVWCLASYNLEQFS